MHIRIPNKLRKPERGQTGGPIGVAKKEKNEGGGRVGREAGGTGLTKTA